MLVNLDITKQAQEITFLEKKMIQTIQVYTLIIHEYSDNLFKSIFVSFLDKKLSFLEQLK